jgi:hypothetical protein
MALDPATLIVSAAISGAVSLSTASVVAGRQERGRRRHAARHEVRSAVDEARQEAAEGVLGIKWTPQRSQDAMAAEYMWATKVLAAADELGRVRRYWVRRRTRQVVSPFVFDLAKHYPTTDQLSAIARLAAAASNDVFKGKYDGRMKGLLRQAFDESGENDQRAMAKLHRQLTRMAQCRWW